VDLDAFYAAVEQRERPGWRGRPLVIAAAPGRRDLVTTLPLGGAPLRRAFGHADRRGGMPAQPDPFAAQAPPPAPTSERLTRTLNALRERYGRDCLPRRRERRTARPRRIRRGGH
jgi:hypothetical protein